jgi:beta-1,2-mannobiose phosphorylase / 1,2-beta-oligomannan phosphorylase
LTSISHLRVARSKNGINFEISEKADISPENSYETFGIEDPRITFIDGIHYINYTAVSEMGITSYLASTTDFQSFTRHGVIFCPDNKDVEIFPEKINGKYYALHRPSSTFTVMHNVWIAESPDLMSWGNHKYLIGPREGYWDDKSVGGSAIPFRVEEGWLEIYHGTDKNGMYSLGALLLDENEPWKVLKRSSKPILKPETSYEIEGFYGNVIFNCGVLYEKNIVKIYYGAADTYMAYAEVDIEDIFNSFE